MSKGETITAIIAITILGIVGAFLEKYPISPRTPQLPQTIQTGEYQLQDGKWLVTYRTDYPDGTSDYSSKIYARKK